MKLDGTSFQNSDTCKGVSFVDTTALLDIARISISGRYPEHGWAMNRECHEMVVVSRGQGRLLRRDGSQVMLRKGDGISVRPKTWFAWDGDMEITMACQPAFYPAQYLIEDDV